MEKIKTWKNWLCKSCGHLFEVSIKVEDRHRTLSELKISCTHCKSSSVIYSSVLDQALQSNASEQEVSLLINDAINGYDSQPLLSVYNPKKAYSQFELETLLEWVSTEKAKCVKQKRYEAAAQLRDVSNAMLRRITQLKSSS